MFMLRDYSKYAITASLVVMTVSTKLFVALLSSHNKSYDKLGGNITTNMVETM